MNRLSPERKRIELAPREQEVYALASTGKTPKQIGDALGISRKNAWVTLNNARAKLQLKAFLEMGTTYSVRGL